MGKFEVGDEVICINNDMVAKLTFGGRYTIKHIDALGLLYLNGDDGIERYYSSVRFSLVEK
jgi:hypothetical protein